jgi:hypothetical protein
MICYDFQAVYNSDEFYWMDRFAIPEDHWVLYNLRSAVISFVVCFQRVLFGEILRFFIVKIYLLMF